MMLTMHEQGAPQIILEALSVPAYVRKKALKPGRKFECTHARESPDAQFGILFSTWNVGCISGKWGGDI